VKRMLRQYLAEAGPPNVWVYVRVAVGRRPVVVDRCHPAMHTTALPTSGCERPAVFLRSDGSIAAVGMLTDLLNLPVVLMAVALLNDQPRSPGRTSPHAPPFPRHRPLHLVPGGAGTIRTGDLPRRRPRPGAIPTQATSFERPPNVGLGTRSRRLYGPM
jgi:hypothetical protein